MQRFSPLQRRFAYSVAALAGFVDVTGFLQLDGYFVSFMTGNTTLLARDLATGGHRVLVPALLIAGFVIGVTGGTMLGDRFPHRRKSVVTLLVLGGLVLAAFARAAGQVPISLALLVLTMGALNTVLSANRGSPVGLTYMTGALVRVGQLVAERIGGKASASPLPFLLLWGSLLIGAIGGALTTVHYPAIALWVASGLAVLLAIFAAYVQRHSTVSRDAAFS